MVARGGALPSKIEPDSIVEAIFEVRFETSMLMERFAGRILESDTWRAAELRYLPGYQIPSAARSINPDFRYVPSLEVALLEPDPRVLRLGPFALSYHCMKRYVGWPKFKRDLEQTVDLLFSVTTDLTVKRLGLRYMNALTEQGHGIRSMADLDVRIAVADSLLIDNVNLNYIVDLPNVGKCGVRMTSRDQVTGVLPDGTRAFVDVDVYTNDEFECRDAGTVKAWLESAHTLEKIEFFHLLTGATIDALKRT